MSISSVTSDYTGRTRDVNIFGYKNPNTQSLSTVSLTFGSVSSFCSGVQKLLQRYTICLLTKLGSQKDFPDFGTKFVSALENAQAQQELQHDLVFANALVISLFRDYQKENPDLPLDEQLQTVTIDQFDYDSGVLYLHLSILTLAGDAVQYILPLPQVET